jgi:hypothetical protein
MVYDNVYFLGEMWQRFLRDQPAVLPDLHQTLAGAEPLDTDASEALLGRFEQWLDDRGGLTDSVHRTTLQQVARAFVDVAVEPESAASMALA